MERTIPVTRNFNQDQVIGFYDSETNEIRFSEPVDHTKVGLALGYHIPGVSMVSDKIQITNIAVVPKDNIRTSAIPKVTADKYQPFSNATVIDLKLNYQYLTNGMVGRVEGLIVINGVDVKFLKDDGGEFTAEILGSDVSELFHIGGRANVYAQAGG
jgi:hypothetical protein